MDFAKINSLKQRLKDKVISQRGGMDAIETLPLDQGHAEVS